jgi:diguanylate cyclase (GGDEF)-like protein
MVPRAWYWLVVLAIAAFLASWFIVADARGRVAENQRLFETKQHEHLIRVEQRIDDYFVDATQLVSDGTELLGPKAVDLETARDRLFGLYRARRHDSRIYGIGAFYAPFQFDPALRFFSIYIHSDEDNGAARSPFDRQLDAHTLAIVAGGNSVPRKDDYTTEKWWLRAVSNRNSTRFYGPYVEDGHNLVSTVKAFYRSNRLVGVMALDTLTASFVAAMQAALVPGEVGYIESSARGRVLLSTGPMPAANLPVVEVSMPLRYTGAYLHVTADAGSLATAKERIVSTSIVFIAIVWAFAGILGVMIVRGWRTAQANAMLERRRVELENEVAVGKKVEEGLLEAAYTDLLTGLPNRAAFLDRASDAIFRFKQGWNRFAVFFIDLDRFNVINDTLGHFTGDELLKMIAVRLRSELPGEALVARLGGDEFLVLAETSAGDPGVFADQILAALKEPMLLGGRAIHTNASIGVVPLEAAYQRPEELLRDADIAMYAAKLRGRGCYAIFDETMRRKVSDDAELDDDLRHAIEKHEFEPYYQPIVSIETRSIISFEALVRWNRPGRGVVGAGEFIEFAEARGLVDAIDAIVLDDVCRDTAALFERFPGTTIAVNISAGHLTAPGLAGSVGRALLARNVAPERIRIEITETAIMTNAALARATLDELRLGGMQIVLDDFGAGHSSLAYLHRLPIAGLKIDRSFIEPLATDPQAVAIVRSIVALAQTLGLYTVAEGVETADQLAILEQLGVPYAQGFFFSPAVALAAVLQTARSAAS